MEFVRLGFLQMLLASLALHAGVAAGIVLAHFHAMPGAVMASSQTESTSLILLRSVETPDFHRQESASVKPAASTVALPAPAALPSPEILAAVKEITPVAPPTSLALEANPNAHLRDLPPEAILSPSPAPRLDGHNGVVFILDISGSMYEPCAGSTRLAFARQTLARRIRALKDGTPFAITVYAESARNSGPLVAASDATREAAVRFIMQDINCGGGTNLPAGLASATQLGTGALVLVSDGDLNISHFELKAKAHDILGAEGHCPALTIVGIFPRPNKQDGLLLQALADEQGGTYRVEQFDNTELVTLNRTAGTPP